MSTINLPILAFNDVYRATPQKYVSPAGHATRDPDTEKSSAKEETISAAQFGRTLLDIREGWQKRKEVKKGNESDVERDGLVLFAGDGGSIESPNPLDYSLM